jgi:signal peptidase I
MSVQTGTKKKESGWAETVRVVFHALIIALVIRTFLFQPFNIPSGSMIPTLLVGDYLFVSKYSYGFTHYSFPFSPAVSLAPISGAGTSSCSACRRMTRSITSSAWSGFLATRSR